MAKRQDNKIAYETIVLPRRKVKRINIGQGETAPYEMWVLFDMNNGNPGSRRYIWYFATKEQALAYKRQQNKKPFCAKLAGPVEYGRYS